MYDVAMFELSLNNLATPKTPKTAKYQFKIVLKIEGSSSHLMMRYSPPSVQPARMGNQIASEAERPSILDVMSSSSPSSSPSLFAVSFRDSDGLAADDGRVRDACAPA